MEAKVLTIPFDEADGFEAGLFQGALEGREVVSATDYLFVH